MRAFLKKDLGVEAAIIDTQASYGGIAGTYRESFNDFVDMHAYWQHPHFPGRPWDGANWTIPNTPMVADQNGGNLARLGVYRVAGKPFTVTEYDHPAPSQYAAEMFPMIASFAALQDWDGLFQFDWGGTDARRAPDHRLLLAPTTSRQARLPSGRGADVPPGRRGGRPRHRPAGHPGGAGGRTHRRQRFHVGGLETSRGDGERHAQPSPGTALYPERQTRSEDGRSPPPCRWPGMRKPWLYTVDAPAAKAVVGRCTGRTTRLDGAEFDVKANPRNFAVLTLNAADGQPLARSRRLLLAAAGNVENTGMGWNADHTSVGTRWGSAPTICEGIAARVTLATTAKSAKVYALDGGGTLAAEVPASLAGGKLSFDIGPRFKTLWYEIVVE